MIKESLERLRISQTDFARLLEVTTRSVSLWATEQIEIPGPVRAYLRLLESLSPAEMQRELSRLNKEEKIMKEGMYGIQYQGPADIGFATVVFENGQIYGADVAGGKYDGSYFYDPAQDMIVSKIKVTIPPNIPTVMGICNPYEWSFDVDASFPAQGSNHHVTVSAVGAKINAVISYLRPMPFKQAA